MPELGSPPGSPMLVVDTPKLNSTNGSPRTRWVSPAARIAATALAYAGPSSPVSSEGHPCASFRHALHVVPGHGSLKRSYPSTYGCPASCVATAENIAA